jgi:hypothetical protein
MKVLMKFASNKTLGLSMAAGALIAAAGLGVHAEYPTAHIQAAPSAPVETPQPPSPPSPPPPPQAPAYDPNQDYWSGQGSAGGAPGGAGGG